MVVWLWLGWVGGWIWMDKDGVVMNVLKIGYYYITKFYLLLMR